MRYLLLIVGAVGLSIAAFCLLLIALFMFNHGWKWSHSLLAMYEIAAGLSLFLACCSFLGRYGRILSTVTIALVGLSGLFFILFNMDPAGI
jgi:hypothetical protein